MIFSISKKSGIDKHYSFIKMIAYTIIKQIKHFRMYLKYNLHCVAQLKITKTFYLLYKQDFPQIRARQVALQKRNEEDDLLLPLHLIPCREMKTFPWQQQLHIIVVDSTSTKLMSMSTEYHPTHHYNFPKHLIL